MMLYENPLWYHFFVKSIIIFYYPFESWQTAWSTFIKQNAIAKGKYDIKHAIRFFIVVHNK